MTGAWLWRQGSIGTPGVADIAPSWWINFGAYTVDSLRRRQEPRVVGFTGFGTLGGGNVSIAAAARRACAATRRSMRGMAGALAS